MRAAIQMFPFQIERKRNLDNCKLIIGADGPVKMTPTGEPELVFSSNSTDKEIMAALEKYPTAPVLHGGKPLPGFVTKADHPAAEVPKPKLLAAEPDERVDAKVVPAAGPKVEEMPTADAKSQKDGDGDDDAGVGLPQDIPSAPGEPIKEDNSLIEARLRSNKQRRAVLEEFNERYAVVNDGGKALIFSDEYDPVLRRKLYSRMKPSDLKLLYQNRSLCSQVREKDDGKPEPKYEKAADYWLKHKERRQYLGGVIFDPSGKVNNSDVLNLWRGFSFEPKQGSWERLKDHIRVVLCQNNKAHFDYLLGWMARLVQLPAKQGEVAVVLRGELGTGKGTLAHALRALFHHQHAMHISSPKHLVGNFNLHLRDCILLFADEAFYAGDKASVGVLKSIITEPVLTIEGKYQNAVQTPNYLHIIVASNNDWVVPAGFGERRFFVLDVSNEHKQDKPYFAAIKSELESGGYAAMLYDLMHHDLRQYEVRNVPETKALQDQKKQSLESKHGWWREVLSRGYAFRSKLGLEDYFSEWHEFVATSLLYDSYRDFSKEAGERHPLSREMLGRFIRELGCKSARPDHQVVGEHLVPGGAALIRKRSPGYQLGNLNDARDAFERVTGLAMEWEDVD
jgi:hypothetical protein